MTKTFKKSLTMFLAFSMLFCIIGTFGNVNANAATDRVSMYSTDVYYSKYGASSRNIYIQTKDNASNQQVYVHYNYFEGQDWKDEQAIYITTLSDGSKIWRASITSFNTEYAIKYIADGQTFWDNNNGSNYTYEYLGIAPITVKRSSAYISYDRYEINVVLKNLAYQKNVILRYTLDKWATYIDVPLSYISTNDDGTENWSATIFIDESKKSDFEYCIYYQVNGQTYWANNFGQNYNLSYKMYQ